MILHSIYLFVVSIIFISMNAIFKILVNQMIAKIEHNKLMQKIQILDYFRYILQKSIIIFIMKSYINIVLEEIQVSNKHKIKTKLHRLLKASHNKA